MNIEDKCEQCEEEFTISQRFPCAQGSAGNDKNDKILE